MTREVNEGVASSQLIGSVRDAAAAPIVDLVIPQPRSSAPGPHVLGLAAGDRNWSSNCVRQIFVHCSIVMIQR